MTQILGTGTAKTSITSKNPVVERKSAQVFFESKALAASVSGYYVGPTSAMPGKQTTSGTTTDVLKRVSAVQALSKPNPVTLFLMTMFYSPGLNEGEDEMLHKIRGDQLYQNLIHRQMMAGAFTRLNSTVTQGEYIPEYDLREIARQNGNVRTRVRFRIAEDPLTGELISRSYEVGEKSGLDRVRVRFATQLDRDTWGFEDPSFEGMFIWSRSAGQGKFEWGGSQTTVHDGNTGTRNTTPPTPIPEQHGLWGLPNPAPEPLPPLPGTPVPEELGPNIEILPIEDRDFNDFIIVDPMGVIPAIYVFFYKSPVNFLEVDYYGNFTGRSRLGEYEVDHIPSKQAVRMFLQKIYPDLSDKYINKMLDKVASVVIPKDIHQKCSETYGGRNNSKHSTQNGEQIPKKELDASDLRAAVDSNWDANAACLRKEHGVSEEKLEEIRARLHELNQKSGLY